MTIGVCIMRKENEKAMVIAYSWYIHKLDRYTYSNNYYLLSVCPTNIEMSVSQWYRWHTNDTPHSSPSPLSDMEETHGRHVFNLYQKLRENRLPVELKLWSSQHGAEHFVLSNLPHTNSSQWCWQQNSRVPPPPNTKSRTAKVGRRERRWRIKEWTEERQRTDAHLTDPSTDRPTNGIQPKNTTASDRKIVQQADSVPCLGKKFSMMPSDRIAVRDPVHWTPAECVPDHRKSENHQEY